MKLILSRFFLELFFPRFCLGCRQEGTLLCQDCQETLDISQYQYCLCNQKPLRLPPASKQGKCGRCSDRQLAGLFSALPYQELKLTQKLIWSFKYQPHIKALARPLALLVAKHLLAIGQNTEDVWRDAFLVPVPMDIRKEKKRGYNQARQLAIELGQIINVPTLTDVLLKKRATPAQMTLKKDERGRNLIGAFRVENPDQLTGKRIFLIDDVYTTGSTMEECARILKTAGARSVWGISIAREG